MPGRRHPPPHRSVAPGGPGHDFILQRDEYPIRAPRRPPRWAPRSVVGECGGGAGVGAPVIPCISARGVEGRPPPPRSTTGS